MNTPIGRDFKRSGRKTGLEFSFFGREFLIGLSIGLAVAFGLFVYQQRALQKIVAAAEAQAQPRPAAPRETPSPAWRRARHQSRAAAM